MIHDNEDFPQRSERRTRNLTNEDIEEIVRQVNQSKHLDCRFTNISTDDLEEAVEFYRNFNKLMAESGSTIWKTVLVLGVGGVCSLLLLGIYSKIKNSIL